MMLNYAVRGVQNWKHITFTYTEMSGLAPTKEAFTEKVGKSSRPTAVKSTIRMFAFYTRGVSQRKIGAPYKIWKQYRNREINS
jgi:hypothetical protein